MVRACALTLGATVPSARFRVGQFAGRLTEWSVDLDHRPAPVRGYPPDRLWQRPFWLAATLAARLPDVIRSHSYDITLLQREMVSTLVTLERWVGRPRVLDVDDAIWLLPRGSFAARLARQCDAVICGNAYLADYFGEHSRAVHILPTAVDTARFTARSASLQPSRLVLGWSGTHAGFPQLALIERALADVLERREHVLLRVVADRPPVFTRIPPSRWEFVQWSPHTEVSAIQGMDIGLMPLPDGDWERGKCSYKLLLYLACEVPAVASPVGMNREVLSAADVGFGPASQAEWVDALIQLVDEDDERARRGHAGRVLVESSYSLRVLAPRLAAILRGAV